MLDGAPRLHRQGLVRRFLLFLQPFASRWRLKPQERIPFNETRTRQFIDADIPACSQLMCAKMKDKNDIDPKRLNVNYETVIATASQ